MQAKQPYTKEAQEALTSFLAPHPLITHAHHKQKIARSVEHYLLKKNAQEVTKEILVKALEDRYPQNEPSTLRLKDPEKMMGAIKQQQAVDKENPMIKISCWPAPKTRTAPPGQDVLVCPDDYSSGRDGNLIRSIGIAIIINSIALYLNSTGIDFRVPVITVNCGEFTMWFRIIVAVSILITHQSKADYVGHMAAGPLCSVSRESRGIVYAGACL